VARLGGCSRREGCRRGSASVRSCVVVLYVREGSKEEGERRGKRKRKEKKRKKYEFFTNLKFPKNKR
jgi:hypothetical protein